MRTLPRSRWLVVALACTLLLAKGQRDKYTVSVHLEASSEESPRLVFPHQVGQPPQTRFFRRTPEVTQRDFTAFHSFPAADGDGFGVVLQLNDEGKRRLSMATAMAQGSLMRVLVNGEGADVLWIDRPINDGRLTIWSGVPEDVVEELERSLPRLAGRAEVVQPGDVREGAGQAPSTDGRDAARGNERRPPDSEAGVPPLPR